MDRKEWLRGIRRVWRGRRLAVLSVFCAGLLLFGAVSAGAASPAGVSGGSGAAGNVLLTYNGRALSGFSCPLIDSLTYVPLRAFAEAMGVKSITWNARTATATLRVGACEVYIPDGGYVIETNGRAFFTVGRVLNLDGRLYVPIRPLARAMGLTVEWDPARRSVALGGALCAPKSGEETYDADALLWLSRIIEAEAGGETFLGKMAVGNVILNRVASDGFPNTIYQVIFQKNQFTPAKSGTIYRTPSQASICAAKVCLEGYSLSDQMLFFLNPRIATNFWIVRARPFVMTIGNHDFYA